MIRTILILLVLTASLEGKPFHAQEIEQDPELRAPTIVVTGARREQAEIYLGKVMPKGGLVKARGVPRWTTAICTSVIGPPAEQGQFIADRVSLRAIEVGLKAGGPECSTNLLIIVTNDPEELLPAIAQKHRALFGFTGDANIDTGGSSSLKEFIEGKSAVRWRQVIETVGADGMPLDGDPMPDPLAARGLPPPGNLPIVRADSTRLRSNVRRQLSRVVVVVDTRQTAGISLGAIADYLAFAALADVGADADLSAFPSILNLFNPQAEHPAALSDWDLAFLKGLYAAHLTSASGAMQYREIAAQMVKD